MFCRRLYARSRQWQWSGLDAIAMRSFAPARAQPLSRARAFSQDVSRSPASSSASALALKRSASTMPVPSMRPVVVTESQIQSYRRDGFVVIPNVLTSEQLRVWRCAVDEAVAARGSQKFPEKGQEDATNVDFEYYDNVFTQRINLWKSSPAVNDLLFNAAHVFGAIACNLEGVDAFRVWHDQALYKEPWANATAWHTDMPYWSFDSLHATSMWLALDDATYENGCMYFLPGTHRVLEQEHKKTGKFEEVKIGKNMNDLFKAFPTMSVPSVSALMQAGSASFHNGMLGHGAGPNMTPYRRRAMTVQMMPDGSTFNGKQNILTQAQMAKLAIGDKLQDPSINPLLYSCTQSQRH